MKYLGRILLAVVIAGGSLWLLASVARVQATQDPEVQFQRAVQLETIEGNLSAAIDLYKQVIKNNGNNRALAARALLRLGGCYEKQGNAEASKAYEQLLRDYADQADVAVEARARIAGLRRPARAESGPSTRRIWAESKTDFFGRVSPDGRYLSFVDWDTGDLAVRDLESGKNRRLTDKGPWDKSSEEANHSIWSPDGTQIAFEWETDGGARLELRVIGVGGTGLRTLYRAGENEWATLYDWSPDGKHILARLHKRDTDQQLVLISVADGTVRLLKKFTQSLSVVGAAISPDGSFVLYECPQSDSDLAHDLFLLPVDGGNERRLVEHPAADKMLGWAPDGGSVLFTSDRRGSVDIWAIRVEEGRPKGTPVMLKSAIGQIHPLGLTRNGSFFYGVDHGGRDIYVVQVDPATGKVVGSPSMLVTRFEGSNLAPQYSPDGRSLAYVSEGARIANPVPGGQGAPLFVRSLVTGEERDYQRGMAEFGLVGLSEPRWSPDSGSILVHGTQRDRSGIYRIDVESGKAAFVMRQLEGTPVSLVGWRDKDNFLYARLDKKNNRGEICVRNLGSGDEKVLAIRPAVRASGAVSPDRQWVSAIERYQSGEHTLLTISTTSGEVRRLIKFSQEEGDIWLRHTWSADSRYVFYARRAGSAFKFALWRLPVDGGQPQKTALEMPGAIDNISAHPDGEHIAFQYMASMSESPGEVWVLENFLPESAPKK